MNWYKKYSILLLGILLSLSSLWANSLFEKANTAYENEDFESAIFSYDSLYQEGFSSTNLHYNLANSYYRNEQIGQAILHYEKALKLAPADKNIQHNLQVAVNTTQNQIYFPPAINLMQKWRQLSAFFQATTWTKFALAFAWLTLMIWIGYVLLKQPFLKSIFFWKGILSIVATMVLFFIVRSQHFVETDTSRKVFVGEQSTLKEAPATTSTDLTILYEGVEATQVDALDGWIQIELPNEEKGWVEIANWEEI